MSEAKFIVRLPSGRKSKPSTRSQIRRQFEAGSIPLPAEVTCQGKRLSVPVEVFVSDGQLLDHLLSGLPDIEQGESHPKFLESSSSLLRPEEGAAAESSFGSLMPFQPPVPPRNRSFLLVVVALAAFAGIALVLSWNSRSMVAAAAQQAQAAVAAIVKPDPEQAAVREYLRENLASKDWEEVRWDAVTVEKPLQWKVLWQTIDLARMVPNPDHRPFFALQALQARANGGPVRYVKLKLRTVGPFGPGSVQEHLFELKDVKAVPIAFELEETIERSWDSLIAAREGEELEVAPTADEMQWMENQKSMRLLDEILRDEVQLP